MIPSVEKAKESAQQSKEFLKASQNFIEGLSSIVESGETGEIKEFAEGNVGEVTTEGKTKQAGGAIKGGAAAVTEKKEKPLPSIEIMQIQVSTKIEKEIRVLEREAARLMSSGKANFSPHKLNDVVARIRTLREILANLVYYTADAIKALWMKYFRGTS